MTSRARRPGRAGPRRAGGRGVYSRVSRMVAAAVVAVVALVVGALPANASATRPQALTDGILWAANSTHDLFDGFERSDFNESGGAPQEVASPNLPGRQALKFSVAPGAHRSEVVPRVAHQKEGDTLYFGYNGYLAPNFPIDANKYQIFMQWHHEGDDGSPPISVNARDNKLELAGGDNLDHKSYEKTIAPIGAGQPVNLVLKIVFSQDSDKGSIDVWSQGRQLVSNFHPPDGTMYDDGDYLKVGMYRDTSLSGTADVFLNNVAVGTDLDSVQKAIGNSQSDGSATSSSSSPPSYGAPSASSDHGDGDGRFTTGLVVGAIVILVIVGVAVAVVRSRRRRSG